MSSSSAFIKISIRFTNDDELCVYHEGAVMDSDEVCKSDIWYQQTVMSRMKSDAVLVGKDGNRYGFDSLLTNTYGKTCPATQDALNIWSREGGSRRGLERWINSEYDTKRADIIRRTIRSVLRAQDRMREQRLPEPAHITYILSSISCVFSRDSKNFSRAMGIADELAILNFEEQTRRMQIHFPALPITKSPRKSPSSIIAFSNTKCRSVFKLPLDQFDQEVWDIEEQAFFIDYFKSLVLV